MQTVSQPVWKRFNRNADVVWRAGVHFREIAFSVSLRFQSGSFSWGQKKNVSIGVVEPVSNPPFIYQARFWA